MSQYKIFTDGGSRGNPGPSACAFVVYNEQGIILFENAKYLGICTNNIAEYRGVQLALTWLSNNFTDINKVNFYLDSQLVVNQVNGKFKVKDANIFREYNLIKELISSLHVIEFSFSYVPREYNKRADYLVNLTLDSAVK